MIFINFKIITMENKVFLMDCMEGMKQYPDKWFELSICDPPYGINVTSMNMGSRKTIKPNKKQCWDNLTPNINWFNELKRISKNYIIWGGNYFEWSNIYNPKLKRKKDFIKINGIIWDKGETLYGRDFSECEIALTNLHNGIFKITPNQLNRIHVTQKPIALYKWILDKYANQGDKILDTHVGSGSSRIACFDYGFDFTGYEIDKDYWEAQEKRFQNHIAQLKLF